ncbi:MAG: hypothetical protein PHF35_04810, partial [Candidatus Moranbacteria bacterium]|nr:hypothetical protein [Candidatus Moranbacteria bacterium]
MGILNLSELMQRMGIHLNGEKSAPDSGTDEYELWREALNESQDDWADVDYDWETLRGTALTSLPVSGTSVGLPEGFVKLGGFPKIIGKEYEEVYAEKTGLKESSDQYVSVNYAQKYMTINPALATAGLVEVPYFSRPTSM